MSCAITLKGKGLKLTPQRRLIIDIIHDSEEHLTAEEILDYVRARMPGVNKSTVYRTLELLEELGCVFKSELGDRFIYHHLVCQTCGRSLECDEGLFLPVERALDAEYGFQAEFKHMLVNGICRDCRHRS